MAKNPKTAQKIKNGKSAKITVDPWSPPMMPSVQKRFENPPKNEKTGQKYKNNPKRAKNRKIGHFSSGPQSIILKIA